MLLGGLVSGVMGFSVGVTRGGGLWRLGVLTCLVVLSELGVLECLFVLGRLGVFR